jgi:spore coat protein A
MLFRVSNALSGADTSQLPKFIPPAQIVNPFAAVRNRHLRLVEIEGADEMPVVVLLDNKMWDDPVSETPNAGTTEIWTFINTTDDAHPIHVHLVQFYVLDRRPFDVDSLMNTGRLQFTGPPMFPGPDEFAAPKDTVKAFPGTIARVAARFQLPSIANPSHGQSFRYVWHCHMLEHEDNEMMRPFDVLG